MKPSVHVSVSCAAAAALWLLTGSVQSALWSLVGGVLIDLDHLYEYFIARRHWGSVRDFFDFFNDYQEQKVYVWFHSVELLLVLIGAALAGWAPGLTWGLAFGMLHHLITDQLGNHVHWGGYSLAYRIFIGFQCDRVFLPVRQPEND
jgi:hypothetical protein